MMEHYGSDFNATGSVMSRAELEDQRRKRGECVRCGQKCFQKKLFKMIPITEHGKVENGRCLNCNPLDAASGAIPAVSRPATEADLQRFSRTQNVLRQSNSVSGRGSLNGGMANRRSASQPVIDDSPNVRRSQGGSRRTSSSSYRNSQSSRSLSVRNSVRSESTSASVTNDGQYSRTDRSIDGDSSVVSSCSSVRGAIGPHTTGRSSESIQSGPMNDMLQPVDNRGVDTGIMPPAGASRPNYSRPNSSRSISASSYYSRDSDEQRRFTDDEQDVDEFTDEYGRPYHEMNGEYNHDAFHQEQVKDYDDDEYVGVGKDPVRDFGDRPNFDYYLRTNKDAQLDDSRHDANVDNFDDVGRAAGSNSNHHTRNNIGSNYESAGGSSHNSYHSRPPYQRNESVPPSGTTGVYRSHSPDFNASVDFHLQQPRSHSLDHSVASFADDLHRQMRDSTSEPDLAILSDRNQSGHRANEHTNRNWGRQIEDGHQQNNSYEDNSSLSGPEFPVLQRLREASNDYVAILNIMHEYRDMPQVQSLGMLILSNLQLTDEDCNGMARLGAAQIIVDGMIAFRDLIDLQISGCRAIWNASFTTLNQLAFVYCGALDILSRSMSNFLRDADFQEQALSVLANLGAAEQNLDIIFEKGIVSSIVASMNAHINRATVQIRGCLAIANLASHHSPLKQKILESGAGHAIVISMVMHPIDPELQEKALRALRNLSANCDENRIEITNIGGIDAIISAMQVHRDASGVQEAGAWTLSNLAGNADSRVLIGDCGGVDVTIRAMWVHSDKVSVQEWCCRALFTLSLEQHNRAMILDVGGISAIVNAMQAHNDSPAIQEMGCAVLFNLASDQQSKMRIVDEEALDAVVLAMVLHSEDDKVQERACQLLLQLCIGENFKAMQASNVGELVRAAASKFPESCGESAGKLMVVIEGFIAEYM